MSAPDAWVKVTIEEIRDIPEIAITAGDAYALVWIGGHRLGRSPTIESSDTLDLSSAPEAWTVEVPVRGKESIPIRVSLHSAADPAAFAGSFGVEATERFKAPWPSGTYVVTNFPTLAIKVETVRVNSPSAVGRFRRSGAADETSGTLRATRAAALEFSEILGLHRPIESPNAAPGVTAWRSEYRAGYTSRDDAGRIFINRDLTGEWRQDTQLIQLTVALHEFGDSLPPDTKVKWTLLDPDDPSNDDPAVHRQWGRYYDPLDYDSSGLQQGPTGGDTPRMFDGAGTGTLDKVFDKLPPWEAVGDFEIEATTNTEVKTALGPLALGSALRGSKVKLHCPNVGGANLMVRAELDPAPDFDAVPAQTGIMTMWKRIDVEMVRMFDAPTLRPIIEDVAKSFEPAFVQLDFWPETELKDNIWQSPDPMARSEKGFDRYDVPARWIKRVSQHRKHAGWFFLGSAKSPYPASGGGAASIFDSGGPGAAWSTGRWSWKRSEPKGHHFEGEYVEINSKLSRKERRKVEAVLFSWRLTSNGSSQDVKELFFPAWRVWRYRDDFKKEWWTRIALAPHDMTSGFTGHDSDGSLKHSYASERWYFPRGVYDTRVGASWLPHAGGYEIPANALCQVIETGGRLAGISPSIEVGKESYFAGRTIVFSDNESVNASQDFYDSVRRFVVHELGHAFGMPHKCGYWDDQTRREESCAMNYSWHWLLADGSASELDPLTDDKCGSRLCGRHAMEIRRVHLEDNKGLQWKK